ncbi:hypothetical protein P3W45_001526 [Vairimorpha bombi]|jgi:hypothetical protein
MEDVLISIIFRLSDLLVSIYRRSYNYFILSLLLPSDISSLENLIICLVDYDPVFDNLLPPFSIFYYPFTNFYLYDAFTLKFTPSPDSLFFLRHGSNKLLSLIYYSLNFQILNTKYKDYYKVCQIPSFNITWFLYTHVFSTYSYLFYNILNIIYVYALQKMSYKTKFRMALFFKNSSFKNYLVYFVHSKFFFIYVSLYVMWMYIEYLLYDAGVANPNFLNWVVVIFVCIFTYEMSVKKRKID